MRAIHKPESTDKKNEKLEPTGNSITDKKVRIKRKLRGIPPPKAYQYVSSIRSVGNSKGVILNSRIIQIAGLHTDEDIVVTAKHGVITIKQINNTDINTDLSTWDKQFKTAKKNGAKPEVDFFKSLHNDFDKNEW